MSVRATCLSPYTLGTVRVMLKGRHEVEITFVPDPPAQPAVLAACREAHLVISVSVTSIASIARCSSRCVAAG